MKTEVKCRRAVVNLNLQEIQDLNSYRIAYGERGFKLARSAMEKVIEAWKVAGKESLAVGNAAEMREALEKLLDELYNMGVDENTLAIAIESPNCDMNSEHTLSVLKEARAALFAPSRNCDKFTTETDAKRAFLAYWNRLCGSDYDLGDLKHNADGITAEYAEWLVAPAMEEKGDKE